MDKADERQLAVDLFNEVWRLMELEDRELLLSDLATVPVIEQ